MTKILIIVNFHYKSNCTQINFPNGCSPIKNLINHTLSYITTAKLLKKTLASYEISLSLASCSIHQYAIAFIGIPLASGTSRPHKSEEACI